MAKTELEIPDKIWKDLEPYKDRLQELLLLGLIQIKTQEALYLYQQGVISFGRAAELAGVSEQEIIKQARLSGIHPRWDQQMADEELG